MKRLFLLLLVLSSFSGQAQEKVDTLAKDNLSIPLPSVHINFGFNYGFTDVGLTNGVSPAKQIGYQLTVNQRVAKFLNASFEIYTGSVFGEEQRGLNNINYRSSLFSTRLGLEYNFYPLLKPDSRGRQLFRPYLGFGLGVLYFRTKGDLTDEVGRTYYYWSDGLIYSEEEGTINQAEATLLERDYEYETELRDANVDGFGRYSQTAFTMPLNAGIRFQLSKNVGFNLAFAYLLNFTDLIDNINEESIGVRQGKSNFDNHLFGSLGLSVYLGRTKPSAKPTKPRFEEEIASEEPIKVEEETNVETKEEVKNWNELESISEQLIDASTSMREISANSEKSIEINSQSLSSIADRKIESKKDLTNAKKESLEVLENSIAVLENTTEEINQATIDVEAVSDDLSSRNIQNQFSSADKIKATVEETIPAMELLKIRIARAKTEEELRSILNISAKNLSHTQNIFSQESSEINESITKARKTVAEVRTSKILSGDVSSTDEINAVREELSELLSQGVLTQDKYVELTNILKTREDQLNSGQADASSNDSFNTTSQLLKNALSYLYETSNVTGENLTERRNELNSIASLSLNSKKALQSAKEEALEILNKALNDLEQASKTVEVAQSDLSKAGKDLIEIEKEELSSGTKEINSSLEKTIALIEDSKSKIKTSKNSSEFKSVLNYASTKLIEAKETIGTESENLAANIDEARKDLILSEVEIANRNAIPSEEEESTKIPAEGSDKLNVQLEKLLADSLIDEDELRLMKGAVSLATATEEPTTSKPGDKVESDKTASTDAETNTNSAASTSENSSENSTNTFNIESIEDTKPKESGRFSWADLNKNNWISPDEVLHFIDLLFEGEAVRTVEDIQELIDYYFDQE